METSQEEFLSEDELSYQTYLLNKYQEVLIARRFWQEHLANKYTLDENDGVTTDGKIRRGVNAPDS